MSNRQSLWKEQPGELVEPTVQGRTVEEKAVQP